jgi:hypothetical protein
MNRRHQFTVVLVNVGSIIYYNQRWKAQMTEHRKESTVVKQMGHGAWAVEQTTKPIILLFIAYVTVRAFSSTSAIGRNSRRSESSRVFLEGFCPFCEQCHAQTLMPMLSQIPGRRRLTRRTAPVNRRAQGKPVGCKSRNGEQD